MYFLFEYKTSLGLMLIVIIVFTLIMLVSSDRIFDRVGILMALEVFIYIVCITKV